MLNLSVIVLTGNEELHIARCLRNVVGLAKDVFIVDSFSTDRTQGFVESFSEKSGTTIHFVSHEWPGLYAPQFNWALDNLPIQTKWVLRLDADEYLTPELADEITNRIGGLSETVTGVVFPLRRVFLDRVIRHGMPEVKLLRLFRYGRARCEERMMDEHIQVADGTVVEFKNEFADHNLNDLSWWSRKHIGYAIREAADLLDIEYGFSISGDSSAKLGDVGGAKRRKKLKYARLPLFWRAFAYFCLRYFVKGGWRDGVEGFLWHFLQGFWYRTLVDAKIWEIKRKAIRNLEKTETENLKSVGRMRTEIAEILKCEYQIDVLYSERSA